MSSCMIPEWRVEESLPGVCHLTEGVQRRLSLFPSPGYGHTLGHCRETVIVLFASSWGQNGTVKNRD